MQLIEPKFEILSMPDGEEALAMLERIGRTAYKSEGKIDSGVDPCPACMVIDGVDDTALEPCSTCMTCHATGVVRSREPSSHRFVKMLLGAEKKAKMLASAQAQLRQASVDGVGDDEAAEELVASVVQYTRDNPPHESVIEHCSASVLLTANRGVTHEIVRHRIASFTQESTRYCDYDASKFGGQIAVIKRNLPPEVEAKCAVGWLAEWRAAMQDAERHYRELRRMGVPPQFARDVLNNALKSDIVMTANFREWRHFFAMRCSPNAHPDMRQLSVPLRDEFRRRIPIIFDD